MSQLPLAFEHRPALGAEDFLVAAPNREAVLWLDRWPDWPAPALAIHGPPGCGKTHLAHVFRARARAALVAPREIGAALEAAARETPRALAIDDADAALADEAAFLHLYNLIAGAGGHLLITAREAPARWKIALPDLRSRLSAAPAVALRPPDDDLLDAVLAKQFADRQLRVGDEVRRFLLARMERSFDAARRIVAALDHAALAGRRNITVPLAREVLAAQGGSDGQDQDQGRSSTWISD